MSAFTAVYDTHRTFVLSLMGEPLTLRQLWPKALLSTPPTNSNDPLTGPQG